MKKRNKPIILVTVLILMFGTVAFINAPKDAFARPPEAPPTGEKVDVPGKSEIAASVAGDMGKKEPRSRTPSGRPGPGGPGGPGGPDGDEGPAIAVRKSAPYKPTPSDSSTSTQWYSEATPKEIPKK